MVCVCGAEELVLNIDWKVVGDGEDWTGLVATVAAVLGSWAETLMICRIVSGNTSQLDVVKILNTIILAVPHTLRGCKTLRKLLGKSRCSVSNSVSH